MPLLLRLRAAEGPVLDLLRRTFSPCHPRGCAVAVLERTSSLPAVKVPTKTTFLAFCEMLMKPPAPARRGPNFETLRLPCGPPARGRESDIQAATVVEIELAGLIDDRLGIGRRTEVEPAGRDAADHAGFGGHRHQVGDLLLGGDAGHPFRHADAEIDHRIRPSTRAPPDAR
jgi:hypothetical protein